MHGRMGLGWMVVLGLAGGCRDARTETAGPAPLPDAGMSTEFDPAASGAIEGQVSWTGPIPQVPPFKIRSNDFPGKEPLGGLVFDNPNAPVIDSKTRGVGQAVVFLRDIDPTRARKWDHPEVVVEQRDRRFRVLQGEKSVRAGFVRRGGPVTLVSRDPVFHVACVRGAAFFSAPFVDRDRPTRRRLDRTGLVELSSGAGYYWMRAYLFVADHPYFTRTRANGHFRLSHVPPGTYRLVCWLPNWKIERRDRDPESALISRIHFAHPLEWEKTIVVERGGKHQMNFILDLGEVGKQGKESVVRSP